MMGFPEGVGMCAKTLLESDSMCSMCFLPPPLGALKGSSESYSARGCSLLMPTVALNFNTAVLKFPNLRENSSLHALMMWF